MNPLRKAPNLNVAACRAGPSSGALLPELRKRSIPEGASTPLRTATEAPTESLLLQESKRLGAGTFLCLGTLCVSVSAASGAQSQVKYPPPMVQSVREACPPQLLSL